MLDRDATPHERLAALLLDLFTSVELRRFVDHRYPRLTPDLREDASPRVYVDTLAGLLRRHGELDNEFFAALRDERPKRAPEIDALAGSMPANVPSLAARHPSLVPSWIPARQHPDAVEDGVLRLPVPRLRSSTDLNATTLPFADEQAFNNWYCAEFWPLTLRWVSLTVRNDGTSPATRIAVSIQVPPTLCVMQNLWHLRAHLYPAKRVVLDLQDHVTPDEAALLRREHESLLRPKDHPRSMRPHTRLRMGQRSIRIAAPRLTHTYALVPSQPFAIMALPGTPVGPIALPCETFCLEYRQRAHTSLTVLVEDPLIIPRAKPPELPDAIVHPCA